MTHAEEIMQAVAELIRQGKNVFSRKDVRDQLGLTHHEWLYGYTAIFQGMRLDRSPDSPMPREKYRNMFKHTFGHGKYVLTAQGKTIVEEILERSVRE